MSLFFSSQTDIYSNCPPMNSHQSLFLLKDIYVTSLPGPTVRSGVNAAGGQLIGKNYEVFDSIFFIS